jgi:two-component system, NarL family, nitrate/nitrite response regulator NarL
MSLSMKKPPSPIRIVIADDHPVVRDGLVKLLEAEDGFEVVGQAADGLEALERVRKLQPDILVLDLAMPRSTGFDVLGELSRDEHRCRVIVLAASLERGQVVDALQLGAHGVVMKDAATALLFKSIRTVMAGQYWIGRQGISDLIAYLRDKKQSTEVQPRRHLFGLTPRELQILGVVVLGFGNKEIAAHFSLSEDTVKHHLSNIFDKLGVSNRLEAALFAIHHHLVDDGDHTPR